MVYFRWFGVLHVDGDIGLATAVYLAAGSGDVHPVGHVAVLKLVNEFIHHGLDHAGSVSARDIAVQPALGVGDHGHGVGGTSDHEAGLFQRTDQ
jgi:hypothetical protein